ncbi:MAG: flavodoxin-dependent (E)-4-hydroxy-3-methylbut-2-enyl-diphosphate synthase [Oscillospiraceae bacterium]|nr:flavodoxin-dependent (E)-4-hydroxy-3-methylbut-2-enyl-diphosphate synthase [Oscillospiraceae bacterium]
MTKRRVNVSGGASGAAIGGGARVSVQSMPNPDTRDAPATLAQIRALAAAGCDIVRLAVPDGEAARALAAICAESPVPLVADIHFDHRLALAACEAGIGKIRINPGNMRKPEHVKAVAAACRERGIPIRIGVNGGSLSKELLARFGGPAPEALAASALEQAAVLEDFGFTDIVLSLKASNARDTVAANRIVHERCDYPLHLGVTEAGTYDTALVKSAAGIGSLLIDGIGDTIRVSVTGDPVREVSAGLAILRACGLRSDGVEIISCPTCGRCRADVIGMAELLERRAAHITAPLTVAVMGCEVNGPGEASRADIGFAGTEGGWLLFEKGKIVGTLTSSNVLDKLMERIEGWDGI